VVADIGIPPEVIENLAGPRIELLTRESMREMLHPREPDSHKGDFGHVLIVAGSRGKTGAAHLAALGALRSGAGLVSVATPGSVQPIVAAMGAEYMTVALPEHDGRVSSDAVEQILALEQDVIAIGPGLGTGPEITAFVEALIERSDCPLVLDADALNALAGNTDRLQTGGSRQIVITPHPGEMGRLVGISTEEVQASRLEIARNFAVAHHVYVVLKGHRTLIATPDERVFINPTGNPGMATGGTGDVLTGMIAAWLAQLLDAEAACRLAVFLHGAAGDLAEAEEGQVALTATDVIAYLGEALNRLMKPGNDQAG